MTYQNYMGFKSIFYFCPLPLRIDSYLGCQHGCLYCFSKLLNNRKHNFHEDIRPADPKYLKTLLSDVFIKGNTNGLFKSCLTRRLPIHFGTVSDPLQPIELKYKISYQMLELFNEFDYPVVLCTKSNLLLLKKYLELIKKNITVQISFSTFDKKLSRLIEPNAPSPQKRVNVLKKLADNNVWTVARLQPFLFPLEHVLEENIEMLAKSGVKHIVLEHLRIPTNTDDIFRQKLWNALGTNMLDEYRKRNIRHSRVNYELDSDIKIENIILAKELTNKYGMTFGSGDNEFHHFSDTLCCCGIPENDLFSNIYKGNFTYGAYKAARSGIIDFEYLWNEWQPVGSIKKHLNSDCQKCYTSYATTELLDYKYKNPTSSNSPAKFYGIEYSEDVGYYFNANLLEKLNKINLLNSNFSKKTCQ